MAKYEQCSEDQLLKMLMDHMSSQDNIAAAKRRDSILNELKKRQKAHKNTNPRLFTPPETLNS